MLNVLESNTLEETNKMVCHISVLMESFDDKFFYE